MVADYLKIIREAEGCEKREVSEISPHTTLEFRRTRTPGSPGATLNSLTSLNSRATGSEKPLSKVFAALERRCPDYVKQDRWQQAVDDGRRFVATWGDKAEALGWTPKEVFGLHTPPANPHPSYNRLSRYDETGLAWLLNGSPVVAMSSSTAAIKSKAGSITSYRKHNKPALGSRQLG